jgi:hypothetical protein
MQQFVAMRSACWAVDVLAAFGDAFARRRVARSVRTTVLIGATLHARVKCGVATRTTQRGALQVRRAFETQPRARVAMECRQATITIAAACAR